MRRTKVRLLEGAALIATLSFGANAHAQTAGSGPPGSSTPPPPDSTSVKEVVVTGSRIARVKITDQPVEVITGKDIQDRGYTNLADVINQLPAAGAGITPIGAQNSFGVGRNYIDLFSLGSNRTLTLVDGLRFVGDNPANIFANTGGNQVDLNALPTLLVDHIDTIPATGAAVYGSDAISGVVNIVMKKKLDDVEFNVQSGVSTYGDAPRYTVELAGGHSFFDGKLNITGDFLYDRTNALTNQDRSYLASDNEFAPNPGSGPQQIVIPNGRFSGVTLGGLPFNPATLTYANSINGLIYLPNANGIGLSTTPAQFGKNGNLVPFNPGTLYGGFIGGAASGGDSLNEAPLTALQTPLDRKVFTGMASYEFSPHLKLYANLYYSTVNADETANQPNYSDVAFGTASAYNAPTPGGALLISANNAFLTPQAKSVLAANGVGDFYLSRANSDISPFPIQAPVNTLNSTLQLVGDFTAFARKFTWNVSGTYGASYSQFHQDNLIFGNAAFGDGSIPSNFGYALDSVINPATNTPICAITLANPNSTNPAIKNCLPFNPFGAGNNSKAVLQYIGADFGDKAKNVQADFQGNISVPVVKLPAGDFVMSVGYEHRYEEAGFTPSLASAEGIGYSVPISGQLKSYDTNEFYGEARAPLLGPGFNFPLAYRLEVQGAYRAIANNIAGDNKAWSFGGEFSPIRDITLRASRDKTFRAPSLQELYSASTPAYDYGTDPCEADNVTKGPNPKARQANCTAALTALGVTPSNFTFSDVEYYTIPVTASGNDKLKNEIGNSWTYGIVLQPRFIPGLVITADYIEINITNALEYAGVGTLMEQCYDSPTYPNAPNNACNLFQRAQGTGQITGAQEGFINAGSTRFAAAQYNLTYGRELARLPFVHSSRDLGRLDVNFSVLNNRRSVNSVSGLGYDDIDSAGTIGIPRWRWLGTFDYSLGAYRVGWRIHYIGQSAYDLTTTSAEQEPTTIKEYMTHDLSLGYKITHSLNLKLNINNVFNTPPPSPVGTYGVGYYDFIGRYFLVGLSGKF